MGILIPTQLGFVQINQDDMWKVLGTQEISKWQVLLICSGLKFEYLLDRIVSKSICGQSISET